MIEYHLIQHLEDKEKVVAYLKTTIDQNRYYWHLKMRNDSDYKRGLKEIDKETFAKGDPMFDILLSVAEKDPEWLLITINDIFEPNLVSYGTIEIKLSKIKRTIRFFNYKMRLDYRMIK